MKQKINRILTSPTAAGGKVLGNTITNLRAENYELQKELKKKNRIIKELINAKEYWMSAHDQQLMELNRFKDEYQKAKREIHQQQRRLDNSRPSQKTIGQAEAEYQLAGIIGGN